MTTRVQKSKSTAKREAVLTEDEKAVAEKLDAAKLKADLDAMLDEIDSVLEENAEEFVKGYVQKGGQ